MTGRWAVPMGVHSGFSLVKVSELQDATSRTKLHLSARSFYFTCYNKLLHIIAIPSIKIMSDANAL